MQEEEGLRLRLELGLGFGLCCCFEFGGEEGRRESEVLLMAGKGCEGEKEGEEEEPLLEGEE